MALLGRDPCTRDQINIYAEAQGAVNWISAIAAAAIAWQREASAIPLSAAGGVMDDIFVISIRIVWTAERLGDRLFHVLFCIGIKTWGPRLFWKLRDDMQNFPRLSVGLDKYCLCMRYRDHIFH
jgi:hypothetical protein